MIKLIIIGVILGFANSYLIERSIKTLIQKKKKHLFIFGFLFRITFICLVFYIFLDKNFLNAIYMILGFTIVKIGYIVYKNYFTK
jgi:hypothetical protein